MWQSERFPHLPALSGILSPFQVYRRRPAVRRGVNRATAVYQLATLDDPDEGMGR